MKKIISILGVISLFAACTTELDTTPEIIEEQAPIIEKAPVLYASIEEDAETKVYLDENYKVLWHADDRISVFNKDTYNLQYRFDGNTGDNSGTFSEVPDGLLHTSNDIENLYAVYPYNASTSISNTSVLTVNFPAAQTYSADSFGLGANTMVAVTDGNNLQFKNACGYLMFKLYGTNVKVKTVSLRGNNNEKIAGEATITMSLGGTPTVAMSGSATDEIVLTCTDPVTIGSSSESYTEFWFAIPPVTFTNGFTVTVTDNNGKVFRKSTSSSFEVVRSYAKKMAPINVEPVPDYFCLTATTNGSIALDNHGSCSPNLEYSTNLLVWTNWNYSAINVDAGQSVYFRGDNSSTGFSLDNIANFSSFKLTGSFEASGNIQSLLYASDFASNLTIPTEECFFRLFYNCTGLTKAPLLPATTLTTGCYRQMFSGCTGLTVAPKLPATTLAPYCYQNMFTLTALTDIPNLPAMSLATACYESMFSRCNSLTTIPVLPATTLAPSCYQRMFYWCTGLTGAEKLPATSLVEYCYNEMFRDCSNLIQAPTLAAETLANSCYSNMFNGCASLTEAPALPVTTLASYCYANMFSNCTSLATAPTLPATSLANGCYNGMFDGCSALISAPTLAVTELKDNCYAGMFSRCTSLTSAPVLPATTLAKGCYNSMFSGCTNLTSAPVLPATTLAQGCYRGMFSNSGLTSAPELPATTLAGNCYSSMFEYCTSLAIAPELPATALANDCYSSMFEGCTSLAIAPELPATALANYCYYEMFLDCTSLASAPELPATSLVSGCYQSMFGGCSSLSYVKALFLSDPYSGAYTSGWLAGVASTGTFVKNRFATWNVTGQNGVPSGWTIVTE